MPGELEVHPLGGVGEFGKNCLLIRAEGATAVIDAGVSFADETMPGVDRIAPDFAPLRGERVEAVFLTHGHEDHIGALGLLLQEVGAPVLATPFTAALARRRLREEGVPAALRETALGGTVEAGPFRVTFLPVSHSIPQSAGLLVEAAGRRILHTGDFKLDADGPAAERTDLEAIARAAHGCDLLLLDSTNAGRPGCCPSEREAREGLSEEIRRAPLRVVLTSFASHVARISGAVESARACGRRVAFLGRSVAEIAEIGGEFGYLALPAGMRPRRDEIARVSPDRLLVVCAGSQGEPMSALHRLALGVEPDLSLDPGDRALFSVRTIPGREKAVARVIDHLLRRGASVRMDEPGMPRIHASGHAYRDDIRAVIRAVSPAAVMPVHGERLALTRCGEIAREEGVAEADVVIADNGDSVFVGEGVRLARRTAEPAAVLLDAAAGVEIEGQRVRERRHLAEEGLLVVFVAAGASGVERVEVMPRGLAAGAEELAESLGREIASALRRGSGEERCDPDWVRAQIQATARRLCRRALGVRPMIIPVVTEV